MSTVSAAQGERCSGYLAIRLLDWGWGHGNKVNLSLINVY